MNGKGYGVVHKPNFEIDVVQLIFSFYFICNSCYASLYGTLELQTSMSLCCNYSLYFTKYQYFCFATTNNICFTIL